LEHIERHSGDEDNGILAEIGLVEVDTDRRPVAGSNQKTIRCDIDGVDVVQPAGGQEVQLISSSSFPARL
jgi:hypothetical protein